MSSGDSLQRLKRLPGQVGSGLGATRGQRLRVALVVSMIGLLMALNNVLIPLDWWVWNIQARASERLPSNQIAFIRVDQNIVDPDVPGKRIELAELLGAARASQAKAVYVDVVFLEPSTAVADAAVRREATAWGARLHFVDQIDVADQNDRGELRSIASVAGNSPIVWKGITSEWPNVAYTLPYSYNTSTGLGRSLSSSIADVNRRSAEFQVDYGFSRRDILQLDAAKFLSLDGARRAAVLRGKTLVISTGQGTPGLDFKVPTQFAAPPSFVSIYGAETLGAGGMRFVPAINTTALVAILLCLASIIAMPRRRHSAYGALVAASVLAVYVAAEWHVRVEFATSLCVLALYAAVRLRARWRDRAALVDPDTGLATLRALGDDLATRRDATGHVVMAKVHGYENIFKTLTARQRAAYICKLSERLKVGDPKLEVHVDGHHLAWVVEEPDQSKLVAHLEGLRALFAAPVLIDGQTIDVGMTFGAAPITDNNRDRCIPAAFAAVEETSEAIEPVRISDEIDTDQSMWDISLRSRIDAAMEAGEVFCVYQPKMDIVVNRVVGVEALVRWEDPDRGFIPPLHFVMQCEKAGRMEYLTRYVLQSACSAAKLLHFRGYCISMSVNISATLLTDMRIVGIVRNVLQATEFDPSHLVLEITETARIRDFKTARTVLKALKALGTQLSMDDFGVGAANFEALQALPFDEIKIDRQFVSRATSSQKSRAITASIVELGTKARIAVVAEGAETAADIALLRAIGCSQVQGYALARPMNLTKLLNFMEADGELREGA